MHLINKTILCPFCGQPTSVTIDASGGDQDDVEDCSNCCNPIHVQTHIDELRHKVQVFVDADDEQYY
ncbi:CPXCG motif-containing cysteine-rich protein [Rheinheimera sp.]|uniref:CPXCG motif-containing cysteine-rich protein n=1 Tax=Rheinheimera sp. TaxID=1869214 RepID=UPI00307F5BB0